VIDFRLQRQLSDPKVFTESLASTGTDYTTFHKEVTSSFKQELLKTIVTEPKLQEHFIERKLSSERVISA
jgi:hypothetical protein